MYETSSKKFERIMGRAPRHPYEVADIEDGAYDSVEESRKFYDGARLAYEERVNTKAVKDSMTKQEAIDKLQEVLIDRGGDYGSPRDNHQRAANLINAYLETHPNKDNLQPEDTMVIMILVKVARLIQTPQHVDSFLDMAGYAICAIDAINDIKED